MEESPAKPKQIIYVYFPGRLHGAGEPLDGNNRISYLRSLGWRMTTLPYHQPQPGCALIIPAQLRLSDGTSCMLSFWTLPCFAPVAALKEWELVLQSDAGRSDPKLLREAMSLIRNGSMTAALELVGETPQPETEKPWWEGTEVYGLREIYVNMYGI